MDRRWSAVELELVRRNYADSRTEDIATALDRTVRQVYEKAHALGLRKDAAYLNSPASGRLLPGGMFGRAYRFPKGETPWNKGTHYVAGGRSGETRFRAGATPQTWVPIGSYAVDAYGLLKLKVSDHRDPPRKDWIYVHRQVWEAAHGLIPSGSIVRFRDGMKTTDPAEITLARLELVTRAENMRRNTYHRYGPEIAKAIQLRGAITRQINRRELEV